MFLSVKNDSSPSLNSCPKTQKERLEKGRNSRIDAVHNCHHIIETCFVSLNNVVMKRVLCRTDSGNQVVLHVMLTSYVADITEVEDRLGLQRGSQKPA